MTGKIDAGVLIDDFLPRAREGYVRVAARTLLIDQILAVPVALILAASGVSAWTSLWIATIYSQSVGGCCAAVTLFTSEWLDRRPYGQRLAARTAQGFIAGAVGAELARQICMAIYGGRFTAGSPVVSWAIGASVATLVGLVLITLRELRGRVASTELKALQARVNPHFLFNTLNSIAALTRVDPARAETMTLQLSSLFRYAIEAPRRGLVSLDEELFIVRGYLAIEQERLGSRLTHDVSVDEALLSVRVPALTLQPLVENAIKHGIAAEVGGGTVRVRGWRDGDIVHLVVTDTGRGHRHEPGTGEGLDNIRGRLRATFGPRSAVTLDIRGDLTEAHVSFPSAPGAAHGAPS